MKKQLKYICVVLGIVALVTLLAYGILIIQDLKEEIVAVQEKRYTAEQKRLEAVVAKDKVKEIQAVRAQVLQYVPVVETGGTGKDEDFDNRYALIDELEAVALRYNLDAVIQDLTVTAIKETKGTLTEGTSTVDIELREFTFRAIVSGSWKNVITYMQAMEEYPRALYIKDLAITSLDRAGKDGQLWQAAYTGVIIVRNKGYK